MFDFADRTENVILCWNIQFTFYIFCPLAILSTGKRKQETQIMEWFVLLRRDILV